MTDTRHPIGKALGLLALLVIAYLFIVTLEHARRLGVLPPRPATFAHISNPPTG